MANLEKLVEELSALTVLEAAELSKLLEDEVGRQRRRSGRRRRRWRCRRCRAARSEGRVHRHAGRRWRQEDQRHQGGARDHRPRPQGSQGPGRGAPKAVKEGVPKADAEKLKSQDRGRRRQGRAQVKTVTGRDRLLIWGRSCRASFPKRTSVPIWAGPASISGPLRRMGRTAGGPRVPRKQRVLSTALEPIEDARWPRPSIRANGFVVSSATSSRWRRCRT